MQTTVAISEADFTNRDAKREEADNFYRTCCCDSVTDKRLIVIFTQLFITLIMLLFCMYMLSMSDSCADSQVYITLIASISGYWLSGLKQKAGY